MVSLDQCELEPCKAHSYFQFPDLRNLSAVVQSLYNVNSLLYRSNGDPTFLRPLQSFQSQKTDPIQGPPDLCLIRSHARAMLQVSASGELSLHFFLRVLYLCIM